MRYKLQSIKLKSNKDILYSTVNYSNYFVITVNQVQYIKILNHNICTSEINIINELYFNKKK